MEIDTCRYRLDRNVIVHIDVHCIYIYNIDIYIYVYVYIYMCLYIHIYIYIYMCVCVYTHETIHSVHICIMGTPRFISTGNVRVYTHV